MVEGPFTVKPLVFATKGARVANDRIAIARADAAVELSRVAAARRHDHLAPARHQSRSALLTDTPPLDELCFFHDRRFSTPPDLMEKICEVERHAWAAQIFLKLPQIEKYICDIKIRIFNSNQKIYVSSDI